MVTLEPPELVSLADRVWMVPILTLPKARLAGETAICPGGGVTEVPLPVPETDRLTMEDTSSDATPSELIWPRWSPRLSDLNEIVLVREIVALCTPLAVGVKFTPKVAL